MALARVNLTCLFFLSAENHVVKFVCACALLYVGVCVCKIAITVNLGEREKRGIKLRIIFLVISELPQQDCS